MARIESSEFGVCERTPWASVSGGSSDGYSVPAFVGLLIDSKASGLVNIFHLGAGKLRTQSQCLERLIESVLVREKPSRHLLAEAVLAGHVTAREAISYASS